MKKSDVVRLVLGDRWQSLPINEFGKAYAPTNIALCKYWGKRNQEINLPVTSSLSISLAHHGALVELAINGEEKDSITLNSVSIEAGSAFSRRLIDYLNLFRTPNKQALNINIKTNIPIAAGLASSACGFASTIKALNELYAWNLTPTELSILARLGSGSASRSIWQGFVEWHAGAREDGMDSHAEQLAHVWPELRVGLLILSDKEKGVSSREAMQRTVATSALYTAWPEKVSKDLSILKQAISAKDFAALGEASESNALSMHATMLGAWPPVSYCLPETLVTMQKIWDLRREGLQVYFTQDAGPNIKLLFQSKDEPVLVDVFPDLKCVSLF